MRVTRANCFEILGIEPTDDTKAIKRAYAQMIRKYHPEDEPEKYGEVREAYECLMKTTGKTSPVLYVAKTKDVNSGKVNNQSKENEDKIKFTVEKQEVELTEKKEEVKTTEEKKIIDSTDEKKDFDSFKNEYDLEKNKEVKSEERKISVNIEDFFDEKESLNKKEEIDESILGEFKKMDSPEEDKFLDLDKYFMEDYQKFKVLYDMFSELKSNSYYGRPVRNMNEVQNKPRILDASTLEKIRNSDLYLEALRSKAFIDTFADSLSKIFIPKENADQILDDIDIVKSNNPSDYASLISVIQSNSFVPPTEKEIELEESRNIFFWITSLLVAFTFWLFFGAFIIGLVLDDFAIGELFFAFTIPVMLVILFLMAQKRDAVLELIEKIRSVIPQSIKEKRRERRDKKIIREKQSVYSTSNRPNMTKYMVIISSIVIFLTVTMMSIFSYMGIMNRRYLSIGVGIIIALGAGLFFIIKYIDEKIINKKG